VKLSEQQINYLFMKLREVCDCPMNDIYNILRDNKLPEHPETMRLRTELDKAITNIQTEPRQINL